jgi:uncharacterized protein
MNGLMRQAIAVRVVPMAMFMLLLAGRDALGAWPPLQSALAAAGLDARWLYGLQAAAAAGLLAWGWRHYGELVRQRWPSGQEVLLAAAVGLAVFVAWVQLDAPWMLLGNGGVGFMPLDANGLLNMPLVVTRILGAVLVVPLMEELFWRSFLMRWIDSASFERVDPHTVSAKAIVLSTFAFVLVHQAWLAATLAGLAYAWLYRRSGKLWVAVLAHAITNAALAGWVLATRQWQFW